MTNKKKSKIKGSKLNSKQLQRAIYNLFQREPKKRFTPKQVIKKLKINNSKSSVEIAMVEMMKKKVLRVLANGKFAKANGNIKENKPREKGKTFTGKVDMTRSGAAFILVDELEDDVFVSAKKLNSALNGDTVEVSVHNLSRGRRPEGTVTKVVERSSEAFMGKLQRSKNFAFVVMENPSMHTDIYVDLKDTMDAKEGDMVVVKVVKWPSKKSQSPIGVITSVLGEPGSSDIAMKSILINNGFELEFPPQVIEESERLNDNITEEELARRRDMRKVTTFTIDPDTAKDFDDALSYEVLENGNIEIGVHIADVTHFVKADTALDKEAYKRSTSVYLVDRVLPMLPEELSNGLCSLRPNEDKFTFSAVFTFDQNDKLVDRWFGKTLTHSDRRFTYEEAQEVIETGEGDFKEEIKIMNRIAHKLRKKKFKNGAIAFEAEEVKFKLDEEGNPIDVYVKERKEAHMLIEDFMLLANKEVSRFIATKEKGIEVPFVYRIHDEPDPDRLADFAKFANELGIKLDVQGAKNIAKSFNELAKLARKDESLRMLEPIAIRTMAKAVYSTENIGHYGLAFEYYSHFTSPIRRYADVLAHRLLQKNLKKTFRTDKGDLEARCKHISAMERKAMTAERDSIKYKQVEFIEKHVGEVFEGRINGMIERGFFIELVRSKVEGMIAFSTLDEGYSIAESRLKATGNRSGRVFKMGDRVKVLILSADLEKKQIEMELVEDE